ncbi:hypothetical protein, partial [Pseudomonas sp. MPR-R1B]|uniref:hypothetical protein n=1 Tax=Pseudomonas sp. MPR-R1B TaxID=2070678 RepID=UPI001C46D204
IMDRVWAQPVQRQKRANAIKDGLSALFDRNQPRLPCCPHRSIGLNYAERRLIARSACGKEVGQNC